MRKATSVGSERASVSYLMHFVVGVMSERWGLRNHERRKALVHIRQILKLEYLRIPTEYLRMVPLSWSYQLGP